MELIQVPGGEITLADRRTERRWTVPVPSFLLATTPLTLDPRTPPAILKSSPPPAGAKSSRSREGGGLAAREEGGLAAREGGGLAAREGGGLAARGDGGRRPVESVSWWDALRLCNVLSERDGLAPAYRFTAPGTDVGPAAPARPAHGRFSAGGRPDTDGRLQPDGSVLPSADEPGVTWDRAAGGYRLPTEAEWEHACRAGTTTARYGPLDDIAWYRGNSGERLPDVGGKAPNAWGLHDMLGTVWEWCWDVYDAEVYGAYRVLRGGGWFDEEWSCRASVRRRSHPTLTLDDVGFRVARNLAA